MAYTEVSSSEIPEGTQYYSSKLPLGDYDFYLQIDATGATTTVVARCDSPDGIRAAASKTFPKSAQISGWSIEANETEASVYVHTKSVPLVDGDINTVFIDSDVLVGQTSDGQPVRLSPVIGCYFTKAGNTVIGASTTYENPLYWVSTPSSGTGPSVRSYSYGGETAYFGTIQADYLGPEMFGLGLIPTSDVTPVTPNTVPLVAWSMLFSSDEESDALVARFAINLGDAGGYPGGAGGWISPGDWNIDPTTTLHLTVNGALSGRHNDPLEDPSYSYVPADKETVKGYGTGGDGGNGGGGGAGASTVIVRQFATNKANSKDIAALAKRHGYGSGGGKGGTGGDGCILIYY